MKRSLVLLVLALMAGGALIIAMTLRNQGLHRGNSATTSTVTPAAALAGKIHDRLMTIAGLYPVACKDIQGGLDLAGSQCFLSTLKQDDLLKGVQDALEPVGQTSGWTNDYSVWGAFYTATRGQRLSFGANVAQIAGDRTLEGLPLTKGYESMVNFVVDTEHTP
ncbi:hypothetical protein [Deinococcus sp. UYEF24]